VGECANGFEAVKAIAELAPDLVFLDIQMPKLDGFEVVELAGSKTQYVFVTAYDQFALRAFEVHALDYLLKPFSRERLEQALAHARERSEPAGRRSGDGGRRRGERGAQRRAPLERILIRDGARVQVIPAASIDYIEAQDDYVQVVAGRKGLAEEPAPGGTRGAARSPAPSCACTAPTSSAWRPSSASSRPARTAIARCCAAAPAFRSAAAATRSSGSSS
jgi:two-component system LytT family response regulator